MWRTFVRGVRAARDLGYVGFTRLVLVRMRLWSLTAPRSPKGVFLALAGANPVSIGRAASRGAFREVHILSMKFDGFGGRIWDMLNAIRVADSLGTKMQFAWRLRSQDGVRTAETTFAPDFLAEHYVTEVDVTQCHHVRVWRPDDILRIRGATGCVWYESKHKDRRFDKYEVASDGFRFPALLTLGQAFERIRFQSDLEAIRQQAESQPMFRLAIHVRRGDVSQGDFRFGSHFVAKAIPYPLVEALIADSAPGRVLLVGNDLVGLEARGLKLMPNVVVASELIDTPEGDELAAVMRDFCLLTRCERIIAGDSLFAILPARIGGAQLVSPGDALPRERQIALLRSSTSATPLHLDAEMALVCNYLQGMHGNLLEESELGELLDLAYRCDPGNPTLLLAQAAAHLRCGSIGDAEAAFEDSRRGGAGATCVRLLRNSFDGLSGVGFAAVTGGFLREDDWRVLKTAAEGLPWAAFYVALKEASEGQRDVATRLIGIAASALEFLEVQQAAETIDGMPDSVPFRSAFAFSTDPGPDEGLSDPNRYNYTFGLERAPLDG